MRISDWSSDVCSSDLLQRRDHLALVADQREILTVGAGIGVGVRGIDVDIGEVVEIAGVGCGRPGAAENLGIGDLQPQGRPAARAVAVEETPRGTREIGRASCRERVCTYV